jgi:hypothetical protein
MLEVRPNERKEENKDTNREQIKQTKENMKKEGNDCKKIFGGGSSGKKQAYQQRIKTSLCRRPLTAQAHIIAVIEPRRRVSEVSV